MRMTRRLLVCSFIFMWVMINGVSHAYGAWYGTVENLSTETLSHMAIAYGKQTWPLDEVSAPDTAEAISFTGHMPRAVVMSMTTKDGVQHTFHLALPEPSAQYMRICLVIKDRDTVVVTYTDPMLESFRLWKFSLWNQSGKPLLKVVASRNGRSWVLHSNLPTLSRPPLFEYLGDRTIWGVVLPKNFDLIITTEDGKQHRMHLVLPPLAEMQPDVPTIAIVVKGPDKATASFVEPLIEANTHWCYTIENRSGDAVSAVEVQWRDDVMPVRTPGYSLNGAITFVLPGPLPRTLECGYSTKDGRRHSSRVTLPAARDSATPIVHLVIGKSGRVTATVTKTASP